MEPCLLIYCWIRKSILNNTLILTGKNSPLCNDLLVFLHEFLGMLCSGKLGDLYFLDSPTQHSLKYLLNFVCFSWVFLED